jgi:hypothetical protein
VYNKTLHLRALTVLFSAALQARDSSSIPPEENVESACEMITVTGKMLAGSENKKTRDTLDGYLARLTRLSGDKNLPSRLRFLVGGVSGAAAAGSTVQCAALAGTAGCAS